VIGMRWLRLPGVAVSVGALSLASAGGALAQDDVLVTNRESVQIFLNPDGSLDTARIYDQLTAYGTGSVRIENPVSTEGLRNLDGFGGFSVEDGKAVVELDVDGEAAFRTVSDYRADLPVSIAPEYRLNGQPLEAKDIVGKSGTLDVRYTVRNETAQPTPVSYFDGVGNEVTVTQDVPVPLVGIFETVLPPSFSSVQSVDYNIAGDGRGGTKLRASLVLFDGLPTGSSTITLFYTAEITDGVMPEVQLDLVPVQPNTHANFGGAYVASAQGAQSGRTLVRGTNALDDGLTQLHDGASELVAGLILIADGAEQLRAGLGEEAAPGARELADGAQRAATGAGDLSAGLNDRLAPGARELADGAGRAASGADELATGLGGRLSPGADELATGNRAAATGAGDLVDGLALIGSRAPELIDGLGSVGEGLDRLAAGLTQLYDGIGGVPAQAQPILDGIQQLRAGVGSVGEPETLLGGLERIRAGLAGSFLEGLEDISAGAGCLQVLVQDIVDERDSDFNAACYGDLHPVITAARSGPVPVSIDPVTRQVLEAVAVNLGTIQGGANALQAGLTDPAQGVIPGLIRVQCGLSNTVNVACDPNRPGVLQGLAGVEAGVGALAAGVVNSVQGAVGEPGDTPANQTLRGGVNGLIDGVDLIAAGGNTLLSGLSQLSDGAGRLHLGTVQLADGADQLAAGARDAATGARTLADGLTGSLAPGARQLADGAGDAAAGARQLADGNREIAAGAGRLADGIQSAADGAGELAEGSGTAAEGAPALVDGIWQVKEGVGLFNEAGNNTVGSLAPNVAMLQAASARGAAEGMPIGAPEDAIGTAAYSITIAGAAGEGNQNLVRALIAIGLLALVAGLVAVGRRRATG
jgi:X-X-X-Leu-X-X-Gly heptad repeat protein